MHIEDFLYEFLNNISHALVNDNYITVCDTNVDVCGWQGKDGDP